MRVLSSGDIVAHCDHIYSDTYRKRIIVRVFPKDKPHTFADGRRVLLKGFALCESCNHYCLIGVITPQRVVIDYHEWAREQKQVPIVDA